MQYNRLTATAVDIHGANAPHTHKPDRDDSRVSLAALMAENAALRSELASLHLERAKLVETQHRIMEALDVQNSERLVHDVRNVLNERSLLRALLEMPE